MTSFTKILTSLLTLLAASPGRQKICRFFQYFCKYLSSRYQDLYEVRISERNAIKTSLGKSDSLMNCMAMTRKILRFGPSINNVRIVITNIIDLLKQQQKESVPLTVLRTLSAFCLSVFFWCDHYVWLYRMGIAKNQKAKLGCDHYIALAWFVDCCVTVAKNILIYSEADDKKKKTELKNLAIDTARSILDMPVAYSFLKVGSVDGKIVGTLGTITSAIGIYQMWK